MSFVRLLLDYTTLDHQRNYDIKKSLKVTNVKEGIQRCEGNSKNCFEETETETETETHSCRGNGQLRARTNIRKTLLHNKFQHVFPISVWHVLHNALLSVRNLQLKILL